MVQHPPAFCLTHGIFPATAFGIGGGASNVTLIGNLTNCPRCNAMCEIIPGQYNSSSGRLNILIDPSISRNALLALQKLAEAVQRGQITNENALKAAQKIHPKAAQLFNISEWGDQAKATLYASIIAGTALLVAAKMSQTETTNFTIIDQQTIGHVTNINTKDLISSTSLTPSKPRLNQKPKP